MSPHPNLLLFSPQQMALFLVSLSYTFFTSQDWLRGGGGWGGSRTLDLRHRFRTRVPCVSVYGEALARVCLVSITLRHVCCVYYLWGFTLCTCTARSRPAQRHTSKLKPAGFAESLPAVQIYARLLTPG